MTADTDQLVRQLDASGASTTLREIRQQPEMWRRVAHTAAAVPLAGPVAEAARDTETRVVFSGAGTSGFVGDILADALRTRTHHRVESLHTTQVVAAPDCLIAEDVPTLMVSFARSGNSPESVAATRIADDSLTDCRHLVITCNTDGDLAAEHADRAGSALIVLPGETNDRGFAMTSSFTCMLLAAWARLSASAEVTAEVDAAADLIEEQFPVLLRSTSELAGRSPHRVVYLGSGPWAGLADESALKILELTAGHVVGVGDSTLGFRHGPKSVLDPTTVAAVFVSDDPYTRPYDLDMLSELRNAQPDGAVVAVASDATDLPGVGPVWPVTSTGAANSPVPAVAAVVGAQLLAVQCGTALGIEVDNPSPGGAVNRVVQGVTIHPFTPTA